MVYLDYTKCCKNPAKRNKKQMETVINDIDIIKEAIKNGDIKDALQMLNDLQEDLKIISLIS